MKGCELISARVTQILIRKTVSLGVLAAGCILAGMRLSDAYGLAIDHMPANPAVRLVLRLALGTLLIVGGLLGLLPLRKPRRTRNTISFPGPHGDVTMNLDSVEATLSRVIGKMPEVKKISVRVLPSEDGHKARVTADVWIYKGTDPMSVSEIRSRISSYLTDTAINILGVEELTSVALNVQGVYVNATALVKVWQKLHPKTDELLLEERQAEQAKAEASQEEVQGEEAAQEEVQEEADGAESEEPETALEPERKEDDETPGTTSFLALNPSDSSEDEGESPQTSE